MRQTIILDSTKIDNFLQCNQMMNLAYIENLTPSNLIKEDISAGAYGHKLLEIYYTHLPCGWKSSMAEVNKFHLNEDFPLSIEKRKLVEARLQYYWQRYAGSDYETLCGTRIKMIAKDGLPVEVEEAFPLVEQGFSYKLYEDRDYLFILEGRIDWLVNIQGTKAFVDHKFQFRESNLYEKSIQFRNYSLVTGLNLGIINYIRLHQKIDEKTLVRSTTSFSSLDIRMWREELIDIYMNYANIVRKNEFPLNRSSCSGKFGYPCQFVDICNEHSKSIKEAVKKTKFVKREPWNPW